MTPHSETASMNKNSWESPASWVVLAMVVVVLSTGIKIVWNAYGEWNRAQALENTDPDQAMEHYERVIHWHVPFLSLSDQAAEKMWDYAADREQQGDVEQALNTLRVLRGAFYAARSFYTPGRDWIGRCNEKIAALMASKPAYSETDRNKSYDERQAEYLELLSRERPPHAGWAVLTEIGFWGWVACAFLFIFKGFSPKGAFQTRPALRWAGGWLACYGLWIWGLFRV